MIKVKMESLLAYHPLTNDLLHSVIDAILKAGSPQKIVLFGSHARGNARADSDLDLLIIEESDLPRYQRSARYLRALIGLYPEKDIIVWTPDEIREWGNVPNAFINTVLKEGKAIYERPS